MDVSSHDQYAGQARESKPEFNTNDNIDRSTATPTSTSAQDSEPRSDVGAVGRGRGWLKARLEAARGGARGMTAGQPTEKSRGAKYRESGDVAAPASGNFGGAGGSDDRLEMPGPRWRPTSNWECVECYTTNRPGVAFCQRCGRLATSIEQTLLANEEFFVIDGLKALRAGDEESAHRCFVFATEHNPLSEVGWYWRARTGETIDEVISCLEQLLRLNPDDQQARVDLDLARDRKAREELVASITAASETASPGGPDPDVGVFTANRGISRIRYTLLELASIPSFALGLMFAGEAIVQALNIAGVRGAETFLPTFVLPPVLISLPGDLVRPVAPSFNVLTVAPVLVSLWYFRLAFRLGDGAPNSRVSALGSGILALAATQLVVANEQLFAAAGIALCVCALLGKRKGADEAGKI